MKQRFFKLLMITTLSVAVLVGCGGKNNDESNKSTETTQKKETTEVSSTAIETTEVYQNSQESNTSEKSKEATVYIDGKNTGKRATLPLRVKMILISWLSGLH